MAEDNEYVAVRYHKRVARWTRLLALFTLLLVIATGIGYYISNRDTERALIASRRPVLALASDHPFRHSWTWNDTSTAAEAYDFVHIFVNTGDTPAINARAAARTYELPASGLPSDPAALDFPSFDKATIVIGPHQEVWWHVVVPTSTLLNVLEHKKRLFIVVKTEYSDIYSTGKVYHFDMCHEVFVTTSREALLKPSKSADLTSFFFLQTCGKYDRAD